MWDHDALRRGRKLGLRRLPRSASVGIVRVSVAPGLEGVCKGVEIEREFEKASLGGSELERLLRGTAPPV